jgi:hypothetical protein
LSWVYAAVIDTKVLILDDVFRNIPAKEETLEKMGKLKGDLSTAPIISET